MAHYGLPMAILMTSQLFSSWPCHTNGHLSRSLSNLIKFLMTSELLYVTIGCTAASRGSKVISNFTQWPRCKLKHVNLVFIFQGQGIFFYNSWLYIWCFDGCTCPCFKCSTHWMLTIVMHATNRNICVKILMAVMAVCLTQSHQYHACFFSKCLLGVGRQILTRIHEYILP